MLTKLFSFCLVTTFEVPASDRLVASLDLRIGQHGESYF